MDIEKCITISINEYEQLLKDSVELQKFKRNEQKAVSNRNMTKVREDYLRKNEAGERIYTQRTLAKKYKVSLSVINRILNNKY